MNTQTNNNGEVRFDTTPHASQLYNVVLQGYGYSMTDGLGDIADNSIDAQAKDITVIFVQAPGRYSEETGGGYVDAIWIIDDGEGMDQIRLQKSFIFSTKVPHAEGSLGHFGAGGSAASFSIADDKYVLTKQANGELLVGMLSKSSFGESGSFENTGRMRAAISTEKKFFMEKLGIKKSNFDESHGTIIGLRGISKNLNSTAKRAASSMQKYCGEVFHKYIAEGITFKTVIQRSATSDITHEIRATDPLLHDNPDSLSYMHSQELEYEDSQGTLHKIGMRYSIIGPEHRPGDLIEKQGIYVNRNKRQIVPHSSLGGLWKKQAQVARAGRVEINFPESLNEDIGLTSAKNKVVLDEKLSAFLKPYIGTFRSKVVAEAQTPVKTRKEIEKQEKKTAENVVKNGATLGVPEISVPAPTGLPNPDSGRGPDKKKRKKKDPNHTRRQHAAVEFQHVKPNGPTTAPWWHKVANDMSIIICINDDHPYIVDKYMEGSDDMKALIRGVMVADIMTQIEFQDNSASRTVMHSFYQRLTDCHNLGV